MPTAEQQLQTIRTTAFFDNAQTKMQAVIAAMEGADFSVEGGIKSEVDGVPIRFEQIDANDATFEAGHSGTEGSKFFYTWRIPVAWVLPTATP